MQETPGVTLTFDEPNHTETVPDELSQLIAEIYQRATRHAALAWKDTRAQVRSWAKKATESSMKGARSFLSKEEHIDTSDGCIDPDTKKWDMDPQRGIQLRRREWERRWTAHKSEANKELKQAMSDLKEKAKNEMSERPFHTMENLDMALNSFNANTGLGVDQWSPDQLKALSPKCKESFLLILNMCERQLTWPTS